MNNSFWYIANSTGFRSQELGSSQFAPVKPGHGILLSLKQGVFWQSLSLRSEFAKIHLKLLRTTLTNGQLAKVERELNYHMRLYPIILYYAI